MATETKKDMLSDCTKEIVSSKLVARNTVRIEYADGTKAIRFHHTDIITWLPNGNMVLSSGGWRTMTTKDRISQFAGKDVWVRQNKGVWYVNGQDFYDGMVVTAKGKLVSKAVSNNLPAIEKMKKKINKFCQLLTKDNIPMPNGGDCWLCCLRTDKGVPMADAFGKQDNDHLAQHVKEGYMHGSLIVNAMREKGFADNQIGYYLHGTFGVDVMRRAIRTYLQKRLIQNIHVK